MAADLSITGYHRSEIDRSMTDVFRSMNTEQRGMVTTAIQSAFSNKMTAAEILTGKSYKNAGVMKTDVNALASGANGGANLKASATTDTVKADLNTLKTNFKQEVEDKQAPLKAALDSGAKEMGLDKQEARDTFIPRQTTTSAADMGIDAVMVAMGAPAAVSAAYRTADAISDVKKAAGVNKLPAKVESQLADMMYSKLVPTRDTSGAIVKEPEIANDMYERLEGMKPEEFQEFLHEALKPPEEHPEWILMSALEADVEEKQEKHVSMEAQNQMAAKVERETGLELDAEKTAPAIEPERIALVCAAMRDKDIKGCDAQKALTLDTDKLLSKIEDSKPVLEVPKPVIAQAAPASAMG